MTNISYFLEKTCNSFIIRAFTKKSDRQQKKGERKKKTFLKKNKNPNVSLPFCSISLAHSSCISFVYAFGIIKEKNLFFNYYI